MISDVSDGCRDGEIVRSGGCHDCGGRCPYFIHVRDGKAIRIEPHEEMKACVRGYAYIKRVYSPDRLTLIRPPLSIGKRNPRRKSN